MWKSILRSLLFSFCFVLWFYLVPGLKDQHLIILGILISLYLLPFTRRGLLALSPFIFYALLYDSLRGFPSDMFFDVHIKEPYLLEKSLFSINGLTPNEFFQRNSHTVLDVLGGFFYLSWVPGPVLFSIWLWFSDQKKLFLMFSYCFVLTNIIGFSIYYLYPAAPPWYVELYGFDFLPDVPPSQGRLAYFDQFFGIELFKGMYSENANKFAAIPSLHSAYPVVLFMYAAKRYKFLSLPCLILILGIWFSAVYLNHHYLIDVLLGGSLAVFSKFVFDRILKIKFIQNIFNYHLKHI